MALWGAITGIIGTILGIISIILKLMEFNKNKAKLICKAEIKYITIDELDVRIVVSGLGRTPVQIIKIKIYVLPRKFWKRFFKFFYYKAGRAIIEKNILKMKINEQEIFDFKLELPKGLEYADIYKLYIIDGVHKQWRVEWPKPSIVARKTKKILIDQFEIKKNQQEVILTSYQVGNKFYLKIDYKITPKDSYDSGKWFNTKHDILDAIARIRAEQEKRFIRGEIDRITLNEKK